MFLSLVTAAYILLWFVDFSWPWLLVIIVVLACSFGYWAVKNMAMRFGGPCLNIGRGGGDSGYQAFRQMTRFEPCAGVR